MVPRKDRLEFEPVVIRPNATVAELRNDVEVGVAELRRRRTECLR